MAEKKELSTEVRLLIAFLLMGLVLFIMPYFYKQPPEQPATKSTNPVPAQTEQAKQPEPTPAPQQAAAPAQPTEPVPGATQASSEQTFDIETDLYKVTFTNKGASVKAWILKDYKDHNGHLVDLVNTLSLKGLPGPFAIAYKGNAPSPDPNQALYQVERPDPLTVNFLYSDGKVASKKSFRFQQKSYLVAVDSELTNNGALLPHELEWRGGFGDSSVVNPASVQQAIYYDQGNSKLVEMPVKNAKDHPVSNTGNYPFAGLEDTYFAGVFLPEGRNSVEITEFSDPVYNQAGTQEQRVGAAVGGEGSNSFTFFGGPKDYHLLHNINPKLDQLINWGWFEFLAKPLFLALAWTAGLLHNNYGWAIILLTVVINTALFPLKITSMKSSRKMQSIQPLVNALNEKYKGIPLKDPRQSEKQEELMALYKQHGINPVGGCLPMLLQLPFFIAFYKVLAVTIQLRGAEFLWVHDLSQPETLAIRILPCILVITQFLAQRMTPSPGMDPSQQKMMMFMPLVFGYMFYYLQAGLVLYYLTSNMVGVVQQIVLNKITPPPAVVLPAKPASKKKNRT